MIPTEESMTDRLMKLLQQAEKRAVADYLLLSEADLRILCEEDRQESERRWLKRQRRFRGTEIGVDYESRPKPCDPDKIVAGESLMTFNGVPVKVARVEKPEFVQVLK